MGTGFGLGADKKVLKHCGSPTSLNILKTIEFCTLNGRMYDVIMFQ